MSYSKRYKIGRLIIAISGRDPIVPYLEHEFSPIMVNSEDPPHLDFKFTDELPPLHDYVHVPPLMVSKESYRANHSGLTYDVYSHNGCMQILIKSNRLSKRIRNTPHLLSRVGHWNYLTPSENIGKNFMYDVFDYLSQLSHLQLGQSYFHASSFERQGRGIAIAAWGGIGKTTCMLKLVQEDGWRYLSDDLSVIDDSGTLWRSPKKMQIYAYNVANQIHLYKALMSGRSLIDRASWSWRLWRKGQQGVRRRVSAEEFFGPTMVASEAKLSEIFFIERWDSDDFMWRPIAFEELARRGAFTILKEIEPFGQLSAAMHTSSYNTFLQTQHGIFLETFELLKNAFKRVRAELLLVPVGAGPDSLADYLRGRLKDHAIGQE